MADPREAPPVEVSLKYMAWNIKQIDESIKRIVSLIEQKYGVPPQDPPKKSYGPRRDNDGF